MEVALKRVGQKHIDHITVEGGITIKGDGDSVLFHIVLVEDRLIVQSGNGVCHFKEGLYAQEISAVYMSQESVSIGREKFE